MNDKGSLYKENIKFKNHPTLSQFIRHIYIYNFCCFSVYKATRPDSSNLVLQSQRTPGEGLAFSLHRNSEEARSDTSEAMPLQQDRWVAHQNEGKHGKNKSLLLQCPFTFTAPEGSTQIQRGSSGPKCPAKKKIPPRCARMLAFSLTLNAVRLTTKTSYHKYSPLSA